MTDIVLPAAVSPSRVLQREDLVLSNGRLALINSTLTPQQAMIEDLAFIRSVLESAGVQFLLVRGNDQRPVIAVDRRSRKAVRLALAAAAVDEPLYSKPASSKPGSLKPGSSKLVGGARRPAVLVAEAGIAKDRSSRAVILFRPRITQEGGLEYGESTGVILEFWTFGDEAIEVPLENALMRHILPLSEFSRVEVEQYGMTWPTIAGMFEPLADEIDFDIDIVFSWVDGAAIEWQRARARRMQSYVVGEGDDSHARFRQLDELKYALRSVYLFAPWIRNIYIVTDSPRPEWLDEHPRVRVVRSEEFFSDPSVLPTHNSHAVESQLAGIDGLAEHFLYSNDDMFFARPVGPETFFSSGGVTRFIEATTRIGMGESNLERSGFENAARVNRRLLSGKFGKTIARHLEHTPVPMRKSVLLELESEFPDDFARTAASRFRSATDISVTNSLYHYYALLTGRAVLETAVKALYVDTTARAGLTAMRKLLKKRNVDLLCLNDGSFPEIADDVRAEAVRSFLDGYYPIPAPWELPATAAGAASQVG